MWVSEPISKSARTRQRISDYTSAQARIVGQMPAEIALAHRQEQRIYGRFRHGLFVTAQVSGDIDPDVDLYTVRMLAFGAENVIDSPTRRGSNWILV